MPEQFEKQAKKEQNQLTNMAIGVSVFYVLVFVLLLASDLVGFQKIGVGTESVDAARPFIRLNEWGDLLAGLFAPLAFLWLVVGYFQQGQELRNQIAEFVKISKATDAQVEELQSQNRQLALEDVVLAIDNKKNKLVYEFGSYFALMELQLDSDDFDRAKQNFNDGSELAILEFFVNTLSPAITVQEDGGDARNLGLRAFMGEDVSYKMKNQDALNLFNETEKHIDNLLALGKQLKGTSKEHVVEYAQFAVSANILLDMLRSFVGLRGEELEQYNG